MYIWKKKFDIDNILTGIRTQITRRTVNEFKRKNLNTSLLKLRKKTAVIERKNYYSYIPVERISQKSGPRSFILCVYVFWFLFRNFFIVVQHVVKNTYGNDENVKIIALKIRWFIVIISL